MRLLMQFDLKANHGDDSHAAVLLQFILQKLVQRLRDGATVEQLVSLPPRDSNGLVSVSIMSSEYSPADKWTDDSIDQFLDELDRLAEGDD